MNSGANFSGINEAKADMGSIYDRPDPRAYFNTLETLDYSIPSNAKPLFQKLISQLRRQRSHDEICVLDLGCSYGVNAALLKHDVSMDDLYEHWTQVEMKNATSDEVIQNDQQYFEELGDPENLKVIGVDQAENAVAFAEEIGLVDEGLPLNLEQESLPPEARQNLEPVDLMISTGCVGYVTEKSFEQLMPMVTEYQPAWIANFVLRMFPYNRIENTLRRWGYETEKLTDHFFRQRRFASAEEQNQVMEQLESQDVDPTGLEADGHFVAEFYLSRPAAEVRELPLQRLLAV
ncbi:MAG: class I SAM-dependent methyltransferase [Rhodospirillales bacterium]|nr:class I SAM-dependent methyltransferase [Rhodospirillales bacterium]|tara:strand:- start:118 stop:990 length:873 start_codon:yes stop_codon:yes gene_type:complete